MASSHSTFSPSGSTRWMACPASMAFAENYAEGSSKYADDGSASHNLASDVLQKELGDCHELIGKTYEINGVKYAVDEERADRIQTYVEDVRRRAMGGYLLCEQKVDLSEYLGQDQGGTSDAVILQPRLEELIVEDLKDGQGEQVYASWTDKEGKKRINSQLGLYALGSLKDALLIMDSIKLVRVVVFQPKLNHIDEFEISVPDLVAFGEEVKAAVERGNLAMVLGPDDPKLEPLYAPSKKACRWCKRPPYCAAQNKMIADDVKADFDTIAAVPPQAPRSAELLSKAMIAVPMIEQWCKTVKSEVNRLVFSGHEVIGPDGKPYKVVEGDLGDRKWDDIATAEAALVGQIGDKAYSPRKVITAPAAAKILDKKKTANLWADIFVPLIKRAPGTPKIALGSDTRPPFSGAATSDDFDKIQPEG